MLFDMEKDRWFDNSPPDQPQGDVKVVILVKLEECLFGNKILFFWVVRKLSAGYRMATAFPNFHNISVGNKMLDP